MSKSDDLCEAYAVNRTELRAVNSQIEELLTVDGKFRDIDLSGARESWLESSGQWIDWVTAVEHDDDLDGDDLERAMALAKLLDQKAALRREIGVIRRRVYLVGAGILKSREKDLGR